MTAARPPLLALLIVALVASPLVAPAQQAHVYRVGVVIQGGTYWGEVDGLREGLKELGLEEGKQVILDVRDVKGDLKSVEPAARSLERDQVDLIFSVGTSATIAVKRATQRVPIIFRAGSDPVAFGLVDSFARPGGRLSGIYSHGSPLVEKRLELLKEMVPGLRRVVTFHNPSNPVSQQALKTIRETARAKKVQLVERSVSSVEELQASLKTLRPGEFDGAVWTDVLVSSRSDLLIDITRAKKLPFIAGARAAVVKGALASYGLNQDVFGRLAAKHVHRVLLGANPADLPVEQVDRYQLVVNLRTARALGLTIPQSVLFRADEVIE